MCTSRCNGRRVQGSGVEVQGSAFRVPGSGKHHHLQPPSRSIPPLQGHPLQPCPLHPLLPCVPQRCPRRSMSRRRTRPSLLRHYRRGWRLPAPRFPSRWPRRAPTVFARKPGVSMARNHEGVLCALTPARRKAGHIAGWLVCSARTENSAELSPPPDRDRISQKRAARKILR